MVYHISYDLLTPGKDYKDLIRLLEGLGAVRCLLSEWILSSNYSATQLRDMCLTVMDANDRILVAALVPSNWAFRNALNPERVKPLLGP